MSSSDLTTFTKGFSGDIVTPDHPDYSQAIARWAVNAERKAKIVAFVKDTADIAKAIKYAQSNGLSLAIRGGGHSAFGASSAENGLVIDLSRHLGGVRVDPAKKLAYIGGGAVWGTVDKAAIEHGLATVGGSVNHTGVAGLLLGGGFGWLSGLHGMTIDNLVQATIVTANGETVIASETENSDLFWGIRGGGCNFGVLVEAVLKLYPQRKTVFAGPVVFKPDVFEDLISITEKWWSNGTTGNAAMHQIFTVAPDGSGPSIVLLFFYNGSEAEGREYFKDFYALQPVVDMATEIPYENLNAMLNPMVEHGQGRYMKGSFFRHPDRESIREAWDCVVKNSTGEHAGAAIFEYVNQEKVTSVPQESTAYFNRGGLNMITSWSWKKNVPENIELARVAGQAIVNIVARGQNKGIPTTATGYGNYDHDIQHHEDDTSTTKGVAETLYGSNYPRLQALKKKYDPNVIFNRWFVITPA